MRALIVKQTVMADRGNRDAVAILVKAPPATAKAVRVNMTAPEKELDEIGQFAAEHGYTRSGFLLRAAKKAIAGAPTKANPARLTRAKGAQAIAVRRLRVALRRDQISRRKPERGP